MHHSQLEFPSVQFTLNYFLLSLHVSPLTDFFWSFRRSKYDILMEHVSNLLQQSPGQVSSIITLKEQLVSLSVDVWRLVLLYGSSNIFHIVFTL